MIILEVNYKIFFIPLSQCAAKNILILLNYMMMKRLFYLLVMFSSVLWSCTEEKNNVDDPDDPEVPVNVKEVYLEVSPSELVFEAQGGEKSFLVQCTALDDKGDTRGYNWTLTGGDEWCRTDVEEGLGWTNVTVTVDAYLGEEDRNTNLTIKAGDKSFVLTVTQKHGNAIVLSKDKFNVPREGGEVTVEVKSNIEYQIEVSFDSREWIKQLPESKTITEKSFTFVIAENESCDDRVGCIIFKNRSLRDTVFIYQTPQDELVLLYGKIYNLSFKEENIVVDLRTNIDYDVIILDNAASWISRTFTKASREDRLYFQIAANEGSEKRTARIVVKDKNSALSDTMQIIQMSKGTHNGDLYWYSEQDLSDFQAAGYTKVVGDIMVEGYQIKTLQKLNNVLTEVDGSITFNCSNLSTLDGLYELKKISGNLIFQSGKITSMDGLESLEAIGGNFLIKDGVYDRLKSFSSFEGLKNLETIGGDFKIIAASDPSNSADINPFPFLTSFKGLEKLKSIGGDFEVNASCPMGNSKLGPSFKSLENLSSFEGLENLERIGGSFRLIASSARPYYSSEYLSSYSSLYSLTSFKGLSSLKSVGGDFEINAGFYRALDNLSSFEGLENLEEIGGSFKVETFPVVPVLSSLASFKGLSGLKRIGGDFEINSSNKTGYNPVPYGFLNSFEGLENLEEIGGYFMLKVYNAFSLLNLTSFKGLGSLKRIGGDFTLFAYTGDGENLTNLSSFEGLWSLKEIGGTFSIRGWSAINSYKGLESLETIGGDISRRDVSFGSLFSFEGLENLKEIGGSFLLDYYESFASFKGLNSLRRIGGDFRLETKNNEDLINFENLEILEEIGGDFVVSSFSSLTSFKGLGSLKKIGGDFELRATSNKLSSFEGLENLVEIGGRFKVIYLPSLTSFRGLSGLRKISGDFELSAPSSSFSFSSLGKLSSFEGLENLAEIGGHFKVIASYYNGLSSLTSFRGLSGLKKIGGDFELSTTSSLGKLSSFEGLENLEEIMGKKLTITNCRNLNNINALNKVRTLDEISITGCSKLYDFCILKNVVQNMNGTLAIDKNGYNPTKEQLLSGECAKLPVK